MPARPPGTRDRRAESTALGQVGDALLAASWLAAVVAVPLYFNPRTERVFEPDKLAWVVLLALVAVIGLAMRVAESPVRASIPRRPLAWAMAFALLAVVAGAVVSAVPQVSWWGLYRRGHGVIAYGAFGALGAAAAATWRPGIVARFTRATALTSGAVALYALLQRARIDNIVWTGVGLDPTVRPFGPLGNPIFLGAYLVMTLPVVLTGLVSALDAYRASRPRATLHVTVYAAVGVASVAALAASQSRGPVLALVVGAMLLAIMWAAATRRRAPAVGVAAIGALVVVGLFSLGRADAPGLGRLAAVLSPGSRTAQERLLVWSAVGELARSNPARIAIGYGPETVAYVVTPFLADDLVRLAPNQVFDRAHNVVLEWWISAGALGVLALFALYVSGFHAAAARMGILRGKNDSIALTALLAGGAVLGATFVAVLGHAVYAPIAGPIGLLAGLAAFCLWAAARSDDSVARGRALSPSGWVALALATALAAHLVEGSVGLPTAAGELLFWVYLGLLATLSITNESSPDRAPESTNLEADGPMGLRADALLSGLALATVLFAPVLAPTRDGPFGHRSLWLLPLALWAGAEAVTASPDRSWRVPAIRLAVPAALVIALAALDGHTGGAIAAFTLTVTATTAALAWSLAGTPVSRLRGDQWRWVVATAVALLACVTTWSWALAPVVADTYIHSGLQAAARREPREALDRFERAVALWPRQAAYAAYLGAAFQEVASNANLAPSERDEALRTAETVLSNGYARTPDVSLLRRLGVLNRDRADDSSDADARWDLLASAGDALDRALLRWPNNPGVLAEQAAVHERMSDVATARALYLRALGLGAPDAASWVGLARTNLALGDAEAAESAMRSALAVVPDQPDAIGRLVDQGAHLRVPLPAAATTQVMFLAVTGRIDEARRLYDAVLAQAPSTSGVTALGPWLAGR